MEITEVRIKLLDGRRDKLQAFASVTFDNEFVVRDLKIIGGAKGFFVAMPSRKLSDRCPRCGGKNHLRASFCNDCGAKQKPNRAGTDERGRAKLHADIAHPIHQACRDNVQEKIISAFLQEREKAKQEGYQAPNFDDLDYEAYEEPHGSEEAAI